MIGCFGRQVSTDPALCCGRRGLPDSGHLGLTEGLRLSAGAGSVCGFEEETCGRSGGRVGRPGHSRDLKRATGRSALVAGSGDSWRIQPSELALAH